MEGGRVEAEEGKWKDLYSLSNPFDHEQWVKENSEPSENMLHEKVLSCRNLVSTTGELQS